MAISEETRGYIDSQIDYYISEAQSYRQIAQTYTPEIGSVPDAAFGIIVGYVYSAFMQVFQGRGQSPSLEEIQEFGKIVKERAPLIKKAILEQSTPGRG